MPETDDLNFANLIVTLLGILLATFFSIQNFQLQKESDARKEERRLNELFHFLMTGLLALRGAIQQQSNAIEQAITLVTPNACAIHKNNRRIRDGA